MSGAALKIGVTDPMGSEDKLQKYLTWLQGAGIDIRYEVLSCARGNARVLMGCGGLVLTGGGDVDPRLYNGRAEHPKLRDVNRKRDDFERALVDNALDRAMPILGICRGMQLANVHFGGRLFEDLAEGGFPAHEAGKGGENHHTIAVEPGSLLAGATGSTAGTVNTYHHQGASEPGRGLKVIARSPDGIPEAMEMSGPGSGAFFLLVQWHPERMRDAENPFSKNLLKSFVSSITARTKE